MTTPIIDRHALRERFELTNMPCGDADEYINRLYASSRDVAILLDELDRLHTWDGLMSLADEHYPTDVFPVEPDRDDRDPGPRIFALLRTLDGETVAS